MLKKINIIKKNVSDKMKEYSMNRSIIYIIVHMYMDGVIDIFLLNFPEKFSNIKLFFFFLIFSISFLYCVIIHVFLDTFFFI